MARVICPNCSNAYTPPSFGPERCPRCGYGAGESSAAPSAAARTPTAPVVGAPSFSAAISPPGPAFSPAVGGMAPQQANNGLAVASMVLGIVAIPLVFIGLFLGILALIFGIVALTQIKKKNQRGQGMAITGIVLGTVVLALYGFFYMFVAAFF